MSNRDVHAKEASPSERQDEHETLEPLFRNVDSSFAKNQIKQCSTQAVQAGHLEIPQEYLEHS
jgi:hypothetical protein